MALRAQVVDFIGLHLLHDAGEVGGVCQITVVQDEALVLHMRVFIDMVHPLGVEQRRAALDAVDLVTLLKQELGEVATVLAGNSSYQRSFSHSRLNAE